MIEISLSHTNAPTRLTNISRIVILYTINNEDKTPFRDIHLARPTKEQKSDLRKVDCAASTMPAQYGLNPLNTTRFEFLNSHMVWIPQLPHGLNPLNLSYGWKSSRSSHSRWTYWTRFCEVYQTSNSVATLKRYWAPQIIGTIVGCDW